MTDTPSTPTRAAGIVIEIDKREFTPERARTTDHHILQERYIASRFPLQRTAFK